MDRAEGTGIPVGGRDLSDSGAAEGAAVEVRDVVVIGGGVSGLTAAWRLGLAGRSVLVLEASSAVGGAVVPQSIAGLTLDGGPESFATRGGVLTPILAELGFSAEADPAGVVEPNPAAASVGYSQDGHFAVAKLPATSMLGIPGDLDDPGLVETLGEAGLERARQDLDTPLGDVDAYATVAELVRDRMGGLVLERLVAPVIGGVYSANPETVAIDAVAPTLKAALREAGSLSAAVAGVKAKAPAGAAVRSIAGGMYKLTDALVSRIAAAGGEIRTGVAVDSLVRGEDGWRVTLAAPADAADAARGAEPTGGADAGSVQAAALTARAVVIATPAAGAFALLETVDPALAAREWPEPAQIELVTIVADGEGLDKFPVGTGILMPPQTAGVKAKAMTHVTAKWAWAREAAAALRPHRHVLRLSYGRAGDTESEHGEALVETAISDARAIVGCDFEVVATAVLGWGNGQMATDRQEILAAVNELAERTGLVFVGSWFAGTGLASVIPQAYQAAEALAQRDSGSASRGGDALDPAAQ